MRCRPAGREGRERSARGGKKGPEEPGGRRRPRGEWGAPRCGLGGRMVPGRPEEGGRRMAQRLSRPPPGVPSGLPGPSSPPGAWRRGHLPAAPLWRACLCPLVSALPSPAFPADGGSRACGGARARARAAAAAAFVLGAGPSRSPRPHGALGASRDARRGGGPPWRLPGGGSGPPPHPRGASEPSAHAGRPPAAASRRPPWTVLSRFPSGVCSDPAVPRSVSLPSGPRPPAQASGPGSAPRLPRPCSRPPLRAPCLPVPRFPLQPPRPLWREGAWVRGCGEGRGCG